MALVVSPFLRAENRSDPLNSLLSIERRALAAEVRHLASVSRRLETAIADLTAASRTATEATAKDDAVLARVNFKFGHMGMF